jgi:hypothetical protein
VVNVLQAALELQEFCQSHQWRFCFIGGLALLRWGEPRETVDVDLTLLTGFGQEEAFARPLLGHYNARIENALEFALSRRVLLLRAGSGVGLDIAFGALPFEESTIDRSSLFEYPGKAMLRTCSAEDLIVMKAFAARPKDWMDVQGVIVRQSATLDWPHIYRQLKPLVEVKGSPEILQELEARRAEFGK